MSPRREDLGSWLEGTPGGRPHDDGQPHEDVSELGLPTRGRGALAGVPRRLAAVSIDWALSLAVSAAFLPASGTGTGVLAGEPLATLAVFGVSTAVLVALLGHTIGHRILGLQVVRLADVRPAGVDREARGRAAGRVPPPGLLAGLVRTALLCLVIPAVVWDKDGRGMHDSAAGTVLVRR